VEREKREEREGGRKTEKKRKRLSLSLSLSLFFLPPLSSFSTVKRFQKK
jgi:hypothetical protein